MQYIAIFYYLCTMVERKIIAYKNYYCEFMSSLTYQERKKIHYGLDLLSTQQHVSTKFVKHIKDGVYELRTEYEGNNYRIFFIFDEGNLVVLFNGFQKKTKKTPASEISKAIQIKNEYYATKG